MKMNIIKKFSKIIVYETNQIDHIYEYFYDEKGNLNKYNYIDNIKKENVSEISRKEIKDSLKIFTLLIKGNEKLPKNKKVL